MSDSMDDTISAAYKAMQGYKQPCDGVLFELPQWIPERLRNVFEGAKNKILVAGYDAKDILKFMHEILEMKRIALLECNRDITLQNPPVFHCETPVLIFGEVSKLAWFHEAVRIGQEQGEEKGLAYLTDARTAKHINMGKDYSQAQANKAKQPRGKISDERETTIGEIIGLLAKSAQHEEEGARELWPHFFAELDGRYHLDPEEITHPSDPRKDKIEYAFAGGRKDITFGQFAGVVSDYRTGKKSG